MTTIVSNVRIEELERLALQRVLNGPDPDGDIRKMYIPREFTRVFAELLKEEYEKRN